jgi:hypothetical protein
MSEAALFALLALFGWLWWDGNRAREIAAGAGRAVCARAGVQFLDDTVALRRMRLQRSEEGRLLIARQYGFEFTRLGERRWAGAVRMLGRDVLAVDLDATGVESG